MGMTWIRLREKYPVFYFYYLGNPMAFDEGGAEKQEEIP
jgi:hypothetical protein